MLHRIVTLLIVVSIAACAGSNLKPVDRSVDLPDELPDDLKKKFTIESESEPKAQTEVQKKSKSKKATPFKYPQRRPEKDPIWIGEKMTFRVSYFGMTAGEFTLTALPFKEINERKVYHIKGHAKTARFFGMFYRLDDTVETFIDYEGIFSHRFHLILDETKQTRNSLELFDSEKKKTFFWNRWNRVDRPPVETKQYFDIAPFPQDSLSALYYLRTVPLKVGETVKFSVVSEGKAREAFAHVIRKERLSTALGMIDAVVVQPEAGFQGALQKQGDSFIWFSDDDRRYVLQVEAKVKVGTVKAAISEIIPGVNPALAPEVAPEAVPGGHP